MSRHRQLLPDDWPLIAAAFTQLRLHRRGLTPNLSYVVEACLLVGFPMARSPRALNGVENMLRELLDELEKELE